MSFEMMQIKIELFFRNLYGNLYKGHCNRARSNAETAGHAGWKQLPERPPGKFRLFWPETSNSYIQMKDTPFQPIAIWVQ